MIMKRIIKTSLKPQNLVRWRCLRFLETSVRRAPHDSVRSKRIQVEVRRGVANTRSAGGAQMSTEMSTGRERSSSVDALDTPRKRANVSSRPSADAMPSSETSALTPFGWKDPLDELQPLFALFRCHTHPSKHSSETAGPAPRHLN